MTAADLRRELPGIRIEDDPAILEDYGHDETPNLAGAASAVAFPTTIDEVVAIVRHANRTGLGLVPSGGRTGLSGGAVARPGDLVVSLESMNRILEFSPIDRSARVEPGVTTAILQDFARENGLLFPVDFASRESSHIGGNIATNAGGLHVIRHGATRSWISGLKVVTGRGDLLDLNRGLTKNATGYDLRHLFIGSEGTLGFVVEATVQFAPSPPPRTVVLFSARRLEAIMRVFDVFRDVVSLHAFEFFSDSALDYVMEHRDLPLPFPNRTAYYGLLEFDRDVLDLAPDSLEAAFARCRDRGWIDGDVMSSGEAERTRLWEYRDSITHSLRPHSPYKNDIAVRVSQVPGLLAEIAELMGKEHPDLPLVWFGHVGDGNVHVNVLKPGDTSTADFLARCERIGQALFAAVGAAGGSISAEHGVGLVKKGALHHTRDPQEVAYLAAIKAIFDPNGVMNPGKLIDGRAFS